MRMHLNLYAPFLSVLCALVLSASATCVQAQTVSMSGSLGDKALLVINGTPRTVAVGNTVQGVRLVSVVGNQSVVEVGGQRITLNMGAGQVNLGGAAGSAGGATRIVLSAGEGGHFFSLGLINGKTVRFIVDTGATAVSMSQGTAEHLGLDFRKGQMGYTQTANGATPVYLIRLDAVRLGEVVVYGVEAVVSPASMDVVLLGNSFLSRFQMRRENDILTLDKRY
jgi:aspartyl protease family protein